MIPLFASIVIANPGGLILALVGVVVIAAIVFFILRQLGAPPVAYTVLYVIGAIIALIIAIDFFFGASASGTVIVH